jgi:hypothetical protein
MKSRLVDTITSNEDSVRLRIFDGDLPADQATAELLRIELAQHEVTRRRLREAYAVIEGS